METKRFKKNKTFAKHPTKPPKNMMITANV